ncbi:MAG: O-antigen ligase family protein, partial [Candidatus Rokuibacteriota bacterium]
MVLAAPGGFGQHAVVGVTSTPERRPGVLDPLVLVGLIALLALTFALFRISQSGAAALVALFFAGSVALSASNGLALLFLVPPFFNGDDYGPYFWLLELLVFLTVVRGLGGHAWAGRRLRVPLAPVLLLFLVSTVVSVPLDLQPLWIELRLSTWGEIAESVRAGDIDTNLFYIRAVLNVATGMAVLVLVANEPWSRARLVRLATASTLLYGAVSLAGLWLYHVHPVANRTYLSLWAGGERAVGFTGLGYNVSFFGQYALAYVPFAALLLVERTSRRVQAVAVLALLLSAYTILITYQRAAYIVLAVELVLFVVAIHRLDASRWPVGRRMILSVIGAILGATTLMLLVTPLGPRVHDRIVLLFTLGDPVRTHLIEVAWKMFLDHPLFGVGTGAFSRVYAWYSSAPDMKFGTWSAHNVYLQLLAEQGALGLLGFLALVGGTLAAAIRGSSAAGTARAALMFLTVS